MPARRVYEFGPYRLDVLARHLLREGEVVPLTPKAFDALLILVEHRERVLGKGELMERLWPATVVEEANLTQTIFMLRKALGETADQRAFIETVPRYGYRFVAEVAEFRDEPPASAAASTERPVPAAKERQRRGARVAAALLGAGLVVGIVWLAPGRRGSEPQTGGATVGPRTPSVAVLPFRPLVGTDAEAEYLGLGMADALITKLGNIRQILVRPTAAVRRYASASHDPLKAGRELRADWVLDGSIQREGERLLVTVQFISTETGAAVWAERIETKWTDIFAVQDSIAGEIARALTLKLTAEEKRRLAKRYTDDPEAHALYLRSRYFWNKRSVDGFVKAIDYARQAVGRDPRYSLAHAAMADSYALLGSLPNAVLSRREAMTRAKAGALLALELDETLAEPHTSLAFVLMHHEWNWPEAEKEFQRAIALNPDYPTAHHWYAYHLTALGRHEEAIAEVKRAHELDPLSVIITTDVGEILFYAGHLDEAVAYAKKALEIDPGFALAHRLVGFVHLEQGRPREAIAVLKPKVAEREDVLFALAIAYARAGDLGEARKILGGLRRLAQQRHEVAVLLAFTYAALGEKEPAFEWLETAYRERSGSLILLNKDPWYAGIRSDPRFADLLRRVGLVPGASSSSP